MPHFWVIFACHWADFFEWLLVIWQHVACARNGIVIVETTFSKFDANWNSYVEALRTLRLTASGVVRRAYYGHHFRQAVISVVCRSFPLFLIPWWARAAVTFSAILFWPWLAGESPVSWWTTITWTLGILSCIGLPTCPRGFVSTLLPFKCDAARRF